MDRLKKEFDLLHVWSNVFNKNLFVEVNPSLNRSNWYIPFKYEGYNLIIDQYTFRSLKSN